MAATARCFDVVHLEDNRWMSCKDVKKQGSLRFYLLSTLIAMVQILHFLQSLWDTLFPFALLWWNVMLYATCTKYYSWNRGWLRSQVAGRHFYDDPMQESCSFSEASDGEERDKSPFSPHSRGICTETVYVEKIDVGSISHQQRKWHHLCHGFGVSIDPFPHQRGLHILEESGPHQDSCETISLGSKAQAVAASSHTSKLSSLCFLDGRWPELSGLLKGCHWAACSFLSPPQVPPLAMLDVHCSPQIPLEYPCLQVQLHRKGNMLDIKVPRLIDHVSINWSILRKFLTSRTRDDNYAILQFILSTTEGFTIFNTYDSMVSVKLRIGEQPYLWGLSGFNMNRNVAYVDNEDSDSASSEDLGSVCCTSIKSDDGCDGTHCTGTESTIDREEGFKDSDGIKQCYGDDGYCCYNCYHDCADSGIGSVEDAVHPAMYKGDGFFDCSAHCNVEYDGPHCVTDVDGIYSMDYEAVDGNFDDNVEDSGAVCGAFHFVYEDGLYESPLEIRQIHVAKSNTWWDEGAILIDKQESEEDSIEQEWQVV